MADPAEPSTAVQDLNEQATRLLALGRVDEAAALCEKITRLDPLDVGGYNVLGQCFLARRDPAKAEPLFRKAIELHPELANLHYNLGIALQAQGRVDQSVESLRSAAELDPDSPAPVRRLGQGLLYLGNFHQAIPCLRRALEIEPQSKAASLSLGQALIEVGQTGDAEVCLRKALSMDPSDYAANSALGRLLQQQGQFDSAINCYSAALKRDPRQPAAYFGLAYSKRMTEQDRTLIQQMEGLLPTLPPKGRSLLSYSLGKSYDDLGEYGAAIRHFDEANRIEREDRARVALQFSRDRLVGNINTIIRTFDSAFFERNGNLGSESDLPVLIVGMIRSGTTLVEQILSSHPELGAAGELPFWRDRGQTLIGDSAKGVLENTSLVAADYLKALALGNSSAPRVTDKMPLNFMALGPIHTIFPRARIIHCRRHPRDTCLSIYLTPYRNGPEFAYNRSDIVFAYRQYERLMAHWREVLPKHVFLEVDYEQLVDDRERVSREMVDFLGLPWDNACLSPETNANSVATPSQWQVRQPVYRSSAGRWKNYEPWLGEFSQLL